MRRSTKTALIGTVGLASAGLLAASAPPPPGGGTGGGTIYFLANGGFSATNADGTNQTLLPAGVSGEPSIALHGGSRWFLYVAGGELRAVRSDAAVDLQLTDSLDGISAVGGGGRWAKDNPATPSINESDSFVTYSGNDSSAAGFFRASVTFDGAGSPSLSGPSQFVLAAPSIDGGWDWAPNGLQVVYSVANVLSISQIGGPTVGLAAGHQPEWSPSGAKIAFCKPNGIVSDLCTINPNGSGLQTLVQGRRHTANWITYSDPHWSAGSTHLTYHRLGPYGSGVWHVWRIQASGGGAVQLAPGVPHAWR